LRVSIQDQPHIGHTTALAAQKHTLLRRNATINRPVHKNMPASPMVFDRTPSRLAQAAERLASQALALWQSLERCSSCRWARFRFRRAALAAPMASTAVFCRQGSLRPQFVLDDKGQLEWERINSRPALSLPGLARLLERPSPFS
jgi:hypothetical protein